MIAHTKPQDEDIPAGPVDRMNFGIGRENNATSSAIGLIMGAEEGGSQSGGGRMKRVVTIVFCWDILYYNCSFRYAPLLML